jgi:uracil-DNA glycosylase
VRPHGGSSHGEPPSPAGPVAGSGERQARLDAIAREVLEHVPCGFAICEQATHLVPGEGPAAARVVLVGEAPRHFVDGVTITEAHGRVVEGGARRVLPWFHPAAALRDQGLRAALFEDARALRDVL